MNQDNGFSIFLAIVIGVISYKGFKSRVFESKYIFSTTKILVRKEYYRLMSSGFLHANWGHLLLNMYSFLAFSRGLPDPFACLVLLLGILGGSVLSLFINRNREYLAYGASGGVSAVIYTAIIINPDSSIRIFLLPSIPAVVYAIGYLMYSVYSSINRHDTIGHDAHIGGAITGTVIGVAAILNNPSLRLPSPLFLTAIAVISAFYFYGLMYGRRSYGISRRRNGLAQRLKPGTSDHARVDQAHLDKLLDKVSLVGYENLSKSEQKRLKDLSQKMKVRSELLEQERNAYYRARD